MSRPETDPAAFVWTQFSQHAAQWGIPLSMRQQDAFRRYLDELCAWNRRFNLTRITAPKEILFKHFLDSLSCALAANFQEASRLIDVGTGAGFPGLPLKIAFPHLHLTLLDSLEKRLRFLSRVVQILDLAGVEILHGRAEDTAHRPDLREQFDVVTARAVAKLEALVEWQLPFARIGGRCIAMKGPEVSDEVAAAGPAISRLGGRVLRIEGLILPVVEAGRSLVIIDKLRPTPAIYPRPAGAVRTRKRCGPEAG